MHTQKKLKFRFLTSAMCYILPIQNLLLTNEKCCILPIVTPLVDKCKVLYRANKKPLVDTSMPYPANFKSVLNKCNVLYLAELALCLLTGVRCYSLPNENPLVDRCNVTIESQFVYRCNVLYPDN
jgi:hypothetical protein